MLGPFATASRSYIAIHQVSHASYSAGGVRCRRQRVTEGTAIAPWNEPSRLEHFKRIYFGSFSVRVVRMIMILYAIKSGRSAAQRVSEMLADFIVVGDWSHSLLCHCHHYVYLFIGNKKQL